MARDLHSELTMRFFRPIPDSRLVRTLRAIALVVVLLAASFFVFAAAEARRLRVDRREIKSPNVPKAFDGARIVFVADIHAGPQLDRRRMAALVSAVNRLDADVLVLGGDYVGGRLDGAKVFYPEASRFKARLGRFAVLGNHDVWEGAGTARAGLKRAGFTLLENDAVRVEQDGQSIVIGGVEDLYTGHPDAVATAKNLHDSDFAILVSHNPDVFAQLAEIPGTWSVGLSGHTHGGQVNLLAALGATDLAPIKRFRSGWERASGVPVLVSNGVGTVTAPLRFFAQPEIHVITLKRGPAPESLPKKSPLKTASGGSHS